jgi:hypothetical protein
MDQELEDWLMDQESEINCRLVGMLCFTVSPDLRSRWLSEIKARLDEIRHRGVTPDQYTEFLYEHRFGHDPPEGVAWKITAVTIRNPELVRNTVPAGTAAHGVLRFHRAVARWIGDPDTATAPTG